jgi:hypothetical protein
VEVEQLKGTTKPPLLPSLLQWRSGEALGDNAEAGAKPDEEGKQNDDEWAAAWSDDDEDGSKTPQRC